jgi:hypothetical protein
MNKQQTFDICMIIVFIAILLSLAAWIVVDYTDKPCKNVVSNSIHRELRCKDKP